MLFPFFVKQIYLLALLLVLFSNILIPFSVAANEDDYIFFSKWNHPSPYFIDVDHNGNIYVAERESSVIYKYNSKGVSLPWDSSSRNKISDPGGISAARTGYIYITDYPSHSVLIFNSDGVYQSSFGGSGTGNGQFTTVDGIAIDASGNIYVTDGGNDRVQKFDKNGNFLLKWGTSGTGNGQLNRPESIAVDSLGMVYVGDEANNRVQKFDSNGAFLGMLGSGINGFGKGDFIDPEGIAIDSHNNVYIADSDNNRIQKFDSSGNWLSYIGGFGSSDGQLSDPRGMAIDRWGSIYVADTLNRRIQKFVPNIGDFVVNVTSSSSPLPNADVWLNTTVAGQPNLAGKTVANGTFKFSKVKPGVYTIKTSAPGFTSNTSSKTLLLNETINVSFDLLPLAPPTVSLRVVVKKLDNTQISGATVQSEAQPRGQAQLNGFTDNNGEIIFPAIILGTYTVKAKATGYNVASGQLNVLATPTPTLFSLTLTPVSTGASLRIKVIDLSGNAIDQAQVTSTVTPDGNPIQQKSTDATGIADYTGINIGDYVIKATKNGYDTLESYVKVVAGSSTITIMLKPSPVLDHFKFDPIKRDQYVDMPFTIVITAIDQYNQTYTQYTGSHKVAYQRTDPSFGYNPEGYLTEYSDAPPRIAKIITFTAGIANTSAWFGDVSPNNWIALNATGKYGFSNSFDVSPAYVTPPTPTSNYGPMVEGLFRWLFGGGTPCIIATATYGGPYAPEVVYMRHVRDDLIGSNDVGKILVAGWNKFYYLWSPPVAYSISGSPPLRSVFTVLLLPLLGSMHVVSFVYESIATFSPEFASVIGFLTAAIMAITIYILLPITLLRGVLKRARIKKSSFLRARD